MIAKIMMNSMQTINTFFIAGIEAKSAFTTSFKPSFLEIILRGRRALRALSDFRDLRVSVSISEVAIVE